MFEEIETAETDLCNCGCEAGLHNGDFDEKSKDFKCTGCSECSEFVFSEKLNQPEFPDRFD